MASQAVAIVHRAEILEAIASGKRLSDIAPKYGVIPNAISKVLKDDPEYRQAIESSFTARLDECERQIEQAIDQVDVARTRALWAATSWRAEREFPARWGQRQQAAPSVTVMISRGDAVITVQSGDGAVQQRTIAPDTYLSNEIKDIEAE